MSSRIAEAEVPGVPPCLDDWRLIGHERSLHDEEALEEPAVYDGATLTLSIIQVGGKPVLYRAVPSLGHHSRQERHLVDLVDRRRLARWHPRRRGFLPLPFLPVLGGARSFAPSFPSSPPFRRASTPPFRRLQPRPTLARPSLNRSNAALLPFTSFLSHLDKALTSLSLHTSARTDFVTYWLPSFIRIHERGQQIAFRFLEQEAYEQAARLEVEPKPDLVTRVFLLFKGVCEEESEGWRKAEEVDWAEEVGVEGSKFGDEKLFRVLEWGGMEVIA
ncbi:hypothetical protein BCR35DRAFT_350845 [Leucosporidium creatinivorum]|uniref:Uncharacterized protein n=1 Tax=Leucosporidium creatinivorum TaxID=106004 RepID=A0A1Y2FX21_9BASI|nr:hypothetical protein BCR35DRAFT_350845 [Leucosporidium creatinivorum]